MIKGVVESRFDEFSIVEQFPAVHTLNLGGGYKSRRMPDEVSTDLQVIGQPVRKPLRLFAEKTGREIRIAKLSRGRS